MANPHIFRQYDIRGVVGPDVTAEVAEQIGRAFASLAIRRLGKPRPALALGRDNRLTSPELADGVRRGMVAAGAHVVDVGLVPTPVHSFAVYHGELDGGLQVTGSHNPPQYNGFKMTLGGSIYGDSIQEVRRMIEESDYESGEGSVEKRDVMDDYVRYIAGRFTIGRKLKVVVDCGNGTGSIVAERLLTALGGNVEVIPIFCESDGTFPNHHPDPVVDKNLVDIIARVKAEGADLGVAFDGDADRIGAIDDRGEIVRGDTLLLLYGLDLIQRRGAGQKVVFDVKCSQLLPEMLEKAGGVPVMNATGHSLIKKRMKEEGSLLSGELSGHIMFGDNYFGYDDALYGAVLLIDIVARQGRPLSEWIAEFPVFVSTAELRYPATEETKFAIVERATAHFRKGHEVIDVDGARVLFGDGWGLIRASNTEPVLVARYEAKTQERLQEIRSEMEEWLRGEGIGGATVGH
ncbi:MAG: Phosphoglucomutase @ Phosphomannomutase [uncultured Gemmatimonadetes bacterium]|uniref:Phosphoglucomutase @ Phosphomannomutase n=1 Tax=uncultured Gemmatimonadota bacterium TaxID=203437 RepID=A0A6J4L3W0_9BACT|nr:MAG: Phosphoglucomutase @ Phosphomannomutase [uncultured Gemmatimonadota bacterium]